MRIAICCDQSAPAEIVRDAVTVGRALVERGHTVAFIAGDPLTFVESAGSWIPNDLYAAPARRTPPNLVMKPPVIDGFADVMAVAGFDDKAALVVLASLWVRLLQVLKPDAIIGFHSPVLWLVGPSVAPTFALGSGLMLPPVLGTSFPRLSAHSTPLADEGRMLDNSNAALLRFGQPEWAALADIFERCTPTLYGVPTFDPYMQIRTTRSSGLLGEEPTPTAPPPETRLAVLLDVYCPNIEQIVLAVGSLKDIPVDICITGATTAMRRFLEQRPNINFWKDYGSLLAQAASASAIVHHSVLDVAQRCISLGRPQLIIPWTREQWILETTMRWMAFTWVKAPGTPLDDMAGTFSALLRDTSLVVAAQYHARQLADTNLQNALPGIIERIERSGPA